MTNCSRVIRHALHFYYALGFVITVVWLSCVVVLLTP
ncbi:DUF3265 domain-containing protein [Vibrio vulnificus]|nr:DUF3265 domain-containing protein [Vibrio vulnificus]RZQ85779.1 DUF3265 domain-containing protein [Vibrio vulnificus]